ncbi:MAG: HTH domain-containing protein [Pirellulaceae bacterium]|jgi:predicted DNA-binding transcriptional regulator YafY|nr:HTH domain-containing protein [Pirellulaceae bacterium]MDP7019271.1 HTH domain-containing protein [Pirellulaceae bacterium]
MNAILNQSQRETRIIQLLKGKGVWNARTLAVELGVSRRTVHRDVKAIRGRGVFIHHDGKTYRIDPQAAPPQKLNEEELVMLAAAVRTSALTKHPEIGGRLDETLTRLVAHCSPETRDLIHRVCESIDVDVEGEEQLASTPMDVLMKALRSGDAVRVNADEGQIEFVPEKLRLTKQHGWFIIGHPLNDPSTSCCFSLAEI